MRRALTLIALLLASIPCAGQSVEMPLPGVVVADGDGKPVAQVVGFLQGPDTQIWPVVTLDVDGTPAILIMRQYGLIDRVAAQTQNQPTVFFEGTGCTGAPWVNQILGLELSIGTHFGVGGPDAADGTYQLYRSTSTANTPVQILSRWVNGECTDHSAVVPLWAAEAVAPNPLDGFHGPTAAQPDRIWTIKGGDRLP